MQKFTSLVIFFALVMGFILFGYYRTQTLQTPASGPPPQDASSGQLTDTLPGESSSPAGVQPAAASEPAVGPVIYRDKVVALIYHHFDSHESDITISPQLFAAHLDMLRAKGYNVISLEQLKNFLEGGSVPPNAVLLTMDDGYASVYQLAFPELKRRNIPAVAFVIGAYMGKTLGALPHFGWEEAREMEAHNISIQSHTYDMHNWGLGREGKSRPLLEGPLAKETDQDFTARVLHDLTTAKKDLDEHLGQPAYALAWPYGRASEKAREVAAQVGFKLIFTTRYGVITRQSNPLNLPRIHAGSPRIKPADLDTIIRNAVGVLPSSPSPAKPDKTTVAGPAPKTGSGSKVPSPNPAKK